MSGKIQAISYALLLLIGGTGGTRCTGGTDTINSKKCSLKLFLTRLATTIL